MTNGIENITISEKTWKINKMSNLSKLVKHTLLIVLAVIYSPKGFSSVIVNGEVSWDFISTPENIYLPSNSFGFFDDLTYSSNGISENLKLGVDNKGESHLKDSSVKGSFDIGTGLTSGSVKSVTTKPGEFTFLSVFNISSIFDVTSDILEFDVIYDFFGRRDHSSDWLFANIQLEIIGDGILYYSDYDPLHPSYQSKWISSNIQDNILTNKGSLRHVYGEEGVSRKWRIRADVILGGRDSFGQPVKVPSPSSISLIILVIIGMVTSRYISKIKKIK